MSVARTAKDMVERAAWWKRRPWPCVVLGVDPAAAAGWSLALPEPPPREKVGAAPGSDVELGYHVLCAAEVNTGTRALENAIQSAVKVARLRKLHLVVSLESWGSGGRLGINQWLGMGEAVGAWKRATLLAAQEGCGDVLTVTRSILRVQQSTWRSRMVDESGDRSSGKFVPYDSEGWKRAATRMCSIRFPYLQLEGANAAEAVLVAGYTMRSDELGRLLPDTYLRAQGFEPLPELPKAPKKRATKTRAVEIG
jgi:hypothetical protein